MIYKFIGDEKDPLTRKHGIKRFHRYEISKKKDRYGGGKITATIVTEKGLWNCPYDSENSFNRNWQV